LIDDLYHSKKLPAVSIVVNDVKLKAGYGYYGSGGTVAAMAMATADIMKRKPKKVYLTRSQIGSGLRLVRRRR
jgi:hypothetical protein